MHQLVPLEQDATHPANIDGRETIGTPAKRNLNGVLLAGLWWPAFRCLLGIVFWNVHGCVLPYTLVDDEETSWQHVEIMSDISVLPGKLQAAVFWASLIFQMRI